MARSIAGLLPRPFDELRVEDVQTYANVDLGVLLVFVERSITTPHLLADRGAIYIRRPGASDPVPINDGRTLSDLVPRGDRANEAAWRRVAELVERPHAGDPFAGGMTGLATFALASSGISDQYEADLFTESGSRRAREAMIAAFGSEGRVDAFYEGGRQRAAVVLNTQCGLSGPEARGPDEWVSRFRAGREGTVLMRFGWGGREAPCSLSDQELLRRIKSALEAAQGFLSAFGGHGDLMIGMRFNYPTDDRIIWGTPGHSASGLRASLHREIPFDDSVASLIPGIHAELARSEGIGPPT